MDTSLNMKFNPKMRLIAYWKRNCLPLRRASPAFYCVLLAHLIILATTGAVRAESHKWVEQVKGYVAGLPVEDRVETTKFVINVFACMTKLEHFLSQRFDVSSLTEAQIRGASAILVSQCHDGLARSTATLPDTHKKQVKEVFSLPAARDIVIGFMRLAQEGADFRPHADSQDRRN